MVNSDFVTLAEAYGFHAERVAQTEDFAEAFDRAVASKTGALLDLDTSPETLTPHQTLSQIKKFALDAKEIA